MIQYFWNKKIVVEIYLDERDVADDFQPLPLFMAISWNHYLGIYYQQIIDFFSSYVIYPWRKDEFHLTHQQSNSKMNGTQIIGHVAMMTHQGFKRPVRFQCHFRNQLPLPNIQLNKFFKYTLKASTSIRNIKQGSALMTLHMSVDNVEKMYTNFSQNKFQQYLGSNQQDELGYLFLTKKTEKVPLRIVGKQFIIERAVQKDNSLGSVLVSIFDSPEEIKTLSEPKSMKIKQQAEQSYALQEQNGLQIVKSSQKQQADEDYQLKNTKYNFIFEKYNFYMHGIKITKGQYPMAFFDKFSHPDGFLYIILKSF